MKIGIIPDTAVGGFGIKRYSLKLIEDLSIKNKDELVVYYSSKRFENELENIVSANKNILTQKIPVYFGDSYFGISVRNFFQLPKKLCESNLDIIHDTYSFGPFFRDTSKNCKVKKIINVHDIGVYLYKYRVNYVNPLNVRFFSKIRYEKIFPMILKNVDGIIVPSENTKKDLLDYYDVSESKVFVIYHGIDFNTFKRLESGEVSEYRSKYTNSNKDLLIGTINSERKIDNIHIILQTIKLLKKYYNIKFILIGESNNFVDKMIQSLNLEYDVIRTGHISDEDLCSLYNALDLFIFLSEYEGFGFPPLESMSCGTLTLVLNKSSLPELVGDGAFILRKKDPSYLLNEIMYLIENEALQKDIIKKGVKRARYFTWDNCIDTHRQIYETIINAD